MRNHNYNTKFYSNLGDGKTHYIMNQLKNHSEKLSIAINEDFSIGNIIKKLRSLSCLNDDVGIFFNFTILPPEVAF